MKLDRSKKLMESKEKKTWAKPKESQA